MKYSPSHNGFFDPEINLEIPSDAIEISNEKWGELLDGQSKNFKIICDDRGFPSLEKLPDVASII